jgi:glycosyltransferase involved in cell wall biosynthesis
MNNNMNLLTAIIPITRLAGRLENLEVTIALALKNKIQVVVIHDVDDSDTGPELQKMEASFEATGLRVISQKVGAPGLARNLGIDVAQSEFVVFWDADDLPQVSQVLESISASPRAWDILIGQYIKIDSITKSRIGNESNDRNLEQIALNPGLWRMVFRREFIKDLRFGPALMGEDQEFFAQCLANTPSICFVQNKFYGYFINVDGQLTSNTAHILSLSESTLTGTKLQKNSTGAFLDAQIIMQWRKIITLGRLSQMNALKLGVKYIHHSIRICGLPIVPRLFKALIFIFSSFREKNEAKT